jgi:hypothetical protein
MPFSNAAAILKIQTGIVKRDDGTFDAHFTYLPSFLEYANVDWLTNGFTLRVSNDSVTRKEYSFTTTSFR